MTETGSCDGVTQAPTPAFDEIVRLLTPALGGQFDGPVPATSRTWCRCGLRADPSASSRSRSSPSMPRARYAAPHPVGLIENRFR